MTRLLILLLLALLLSYALYGGIVAADDSPLPDPDRQKPLPPRPIRSPLVPGVEKPVYKYYYPVVGGGNR